jgi:hypothetical protein
VKAFGYALLVLAAVLTVGATWFWALAGMSEPVGWAWVLTIYVVGVGGAVLVAWKAMS